MSIYPDFAGCTRVFNYKNSSIDLTTNVFKVGLRRQEVSPVQARIIAAIFDSEAQQKPMGAVQYAQLLGYASSDAFRGAFSRLMTALDDFVIANDGGTGSVYFEDFSSRASHLFLSGKNGYGINTIIADAVSSVPVISEEVLFADLARS